MKSITVEELKELLKVKGSTFISIESETQPKLKGGKKCPYAGIIKRAKVNGLVNFKYEDGVNRKKEKEGKEPNFKADLPTWGQTYEDHKAIVEHKGKFYLYMKIQSLSSEDYFLNGQRIEKDKLSQYLREGSNPKQQLNDDYIVKKYTLKNIKRITIKGEQYAVVNPE